jgi:hypothetical protein
MRIVCTPALDANYSISWGFIPAVDGSNCCPAAMPCESRAGPAAGAILGAIFSGGKGAAIGAATGVGAANTNTSHAALTKN